MMVWSVLKYLENRHSEGATDQVSAIMRRLEQRKARKEPVKRSTRLATPRIIACIGPEALTDNPDEAARSMHYRLEIAKALKHAGGVRVVEREELIPLLKELDIGVSGITHAKARQEIGKLLPAGLLLFGDILPEDEG